MFFITKHIQNIKEKPEYIRKRYVLAYVSVSMFFIVVIWLVSTSQKMQIIFQLKNLENILPQKELMEEGKEIYKETEELKYNTLQQLETQYDDKNVKSEDEQQNLNISNTDQIREKN